MAVTGQDITQAKIHLDKGELVAIPTETVYGLAGNALDPIAVASIFETKNRPSFDPLIIHVSSIDAVKKYVLDFPEILQKLALNLWPGPLTLLLPRKSIVPDLVTSGLERVAVRVPDHPLTRQLLERLDYPLAAPSANPFGYISPTTPLHVDAQLGNRIPYILDGGACRVGIESTIVGMEGDEAVIYRLGGTEIQKIENVVGKLVVRSHSTSNPQAPGLLESHYAPRKLLLLGHLTKMIPEWQAKNQNFAVLSLSAHFPELPEYRQISLSPSGDLKEAAANLFAAMRKLDESDAEIILSELMPDEGLGKSINDRLTRAAAKESIK